jgi:hypothetical protein
MVFCPQITKPAIAGFVICGKSKQTYLPNFKKSSPLPSSSKPALL